MIDRHKVNFVLEAFHGSAGKGKVSTWLADNFNCGVISCSNGPNSGHTAWIDGEKYMAKVLPTALCLNKAKGRSLIGVLTAGCIFDPTRLWQEWLEFGKPHLRIHSRSLLLTDDHRNREAKSLKAIASTMQGTAAAITDKIMRGDCLMAGSLMQEMEELWKLLTTDDSLINEFKDKVKVLEPHEMQEMTIQALHDGRGWIHEIAQGYALSIDFGSHYPQCTSRNCSVPKALDDLGLAPKYCGKVTMNLRPYPIRVGNIVGEDGKTEGYSGDWFPDQTEITWEEVAHTAQMPKGMAEELKAREFTTVTGRLRRVATFSKEGLNRAIIGNAPDYLVLNFAQYVDFRINEKRDLEDLRYLERLHNFIDMIEGCSGVPVVQLGTGKENDDVINLPKMPR